MKKIVVFIYRTPAPVLLVSIPVFFVKPVLLTEGTDVCATKQDSLGRSVKKVKHTQNIIVERKYHYRKGYEDLKEKKWKLQCLTHVK